MAQWSMIAKERQKPASTAGLSRFSVQNTRIKKVVFLCFAFVYSRLRRKNQNFTVQGGGSFLKRRFILDPAVYFLRFEGRKLTSEAALRPVKTFFIRVFCT